MCRGAVRRLLYDCTMMGDEDGWALTQREAAAIALQVLRDQPE